MTKPSLRHAHNLVSMAHIIAQAGNRAVATAYLARAAKIFTQHGETELARRCKELSRR